MRLNWQARAIWLAVLLAFLMLLPYEELKGYSVFWLSCVLAIPIYHYRINYRLFARRAIIATGCTEDGKAKRWLWNGSMLKASNCVASVFIAYLVILSAAFLDVYEWAIVVSASALLILLEVASKGFAERETVARFLPIFHRESIKWPVYIWVILASSTVYFLGDHENLAGQDSFVLAENRFRESITNFDSLILGVSHGWLSAIDAATLNLAQKYIPAIEQSWAKIVLWLYLSIKSSAAMGIIVYLLLGMLTVVTEKDRQGWVILGRTIFDKSFTLTLILLFAISISISSISVRAPLIIPTNNSLDCSLIASNLQQVAANRNREIAVEEDLLQKDVNAIIDGSIDTIFGYSEQGVDSYLDWHFSVRGQYERLGARVFSSLLSSSEQKINELITNDIDNQLAQTNQNIISNIGAQINASGNLTQSQLSGFSLGSECGFTPIEIPSLDSIGVGQPQFAITTTGLAGTVIAKKVAAKVGAKAATKVGSKVLGSLGTGMVVGSVCGPFAPVCGVAAAAGLWLGIDKAMVEYEERSERDSLKITMMEALEEQKSALKNQFTSYYSGRISEAYDMLSPFNILDDGL